MSHKQKTVLVTGGAGFIGSHLCERLVGDGHKVISLDNYFAGTKDNHIEGATYVEGHTKNIEKLVKEKLDLIFHLGEYARVEASLKEPDVVWDLNKEGTFRVLEYCRKHKIKIVYAGSSTKYGDGGLARDQSPYGWTKASNTELVKNYGGWYGLDYAITYFYNVYGPRERTADKFGTVIATFIDQYKKNEPLTITAPGTQVRNFTHVDDIVCGLEHIGEKGHGDEYGLGNDKAYSILEIAKMFDAEIKMLPEHPGNRILSSFDLTKAKHELGWEAKMDVTDYIRDAIGNS